MEPKLFPPGEMEGGMAKTRQAREYVTLIGAMNKADWATALHLAKKLLVDAPGLGQLHHIAAVAAYCMGRTKESLCYSFEAVRLAPGKPEYVIQLAKVVAKDQLPQSALPYADGAVPMAWDDAAMCHQLSIIYMQANAYEKASCLSERAVQLRDGNVTYLSNYATTLSFNGKVKEAEIAYEAVLALKPVHGQAHLGLAQLRKQTPLFNHVERLKDMLPLAQDMQGRQYMHLALAKELEDLGEYASSFEHLVRGKTEGHDFRNYSLRKDVLLFDAIKAHFRILPVREEGFASDEPIFVFGMPRTGTTLVDRILSSHPDVQSAGELRNFGVLLKHASGSTTPALLDVNTVELAKTVAWAKLGETYIASTRPLTGQRKRFVDKLPHNFLYMAMIAKALPDARLICLRRNPVDACLSNFRQLFSSSSHFHGYSFDLLDIGRYYLQFHRFMEHWSSAIPGRFLQVQYEALVENQESQTRRLLDYCQLGWTQSCMQFQSNDAPVATASAIQVRSGLHSNAVDRWRHYSRQLQPLLDLLREGGVWIDEGEF